MIFIKTNFTKDKLGNIYYTHSVGEQIRENKEVERFINAIFERYQLCDFGELCKEDIDSNLKNIENGREGVPVFATYKIPDSLPNFFGNNGERKVKIITYLKKDTFIYFRGEH